MDGNRISIDGFQKFSKIISANKSITDIRIPETDINQMISISKDKENKRTQIANILISLRTLYNNNSKKSYLFHAFGISHNQNPKFRESMEDEVVVIENFLPGYHLFALFDGHGGRRVLEHVVLTFPKILKKNFQLFPKDPQKAFSISFSEMDKFLFDIPIKKSGSTASLALMTKNENGEKVILTANVGDSKMVLCRDKTVKQLTYDHRVSDKNESQRVIDSGGTIFRDRVGGIINITRALGDLEAKKMGVICEPYFESNFLLKEDTHLIIACDGLWDTPNVEKKNIGIIS